MVVRFLLTKLDDTCSLVLGHCWLARYNPLIDWSLARITFNQENKLAPNILPEPASQDYPVMASSAIPIYCEHPYLKGAKSSQPDIAFTGASEFFKLSQLKGARTALLYIDMPTVHAKSVSAKPTSETGENIPSRYHEFLDIFSKKKS